MFSSLPLADGQWTLRSFLPCAFPQPIGTHMHATYVGTNRRDLAMALVALWCSQVPSFWAPTTDKEGIDSRSKHTPK